MGTRSYQEPARPMKVTATLSGTNWRTFAWRLEAILSLLIQLVMEAKFSFI